jgi:Protein of unknown function (DUF3592)
VHLTLWRGPRETLLAFVLIGSGFLVFWRWSLLNWHARGMILAAYGIVLLLVVLLPALRTRGLLKSGAAAQGTVVGAEQKTSTDNDGFTHTYYHPRVRFSTPDGRAVVFTSTFGSQSEPDLGGSLPVRYRVEDPEQAEVDSALTWVIRAALGFLGGLGLLVAGVVVYSNEPQAVPAAPAVVDSVNGTGQVEQAPAPLPPPPKVATGKIGDKLTVYDESGAAQLEVTVTRLKFSTGDQFDQPQHGLYMGAYVKAHALADEQFLDIYALVGSHHYDGDAIISSTAFDPALDVVTLMTGERASGWLVFDVPARHGQLVLRDLDEHKIGVWKY